MPDASEASTRFAKAFAWLSSFTDWEQKLHEVKARSTFDLGRMRRLLTDFGNPHEGPAIAHITGTKGKTSTTWMTDAILNAHGLRCLRFLSPHLKRPHERIAFRGQPLDDLQFARLIEALQEVILPREQSAPEDLPSFFEAMTLAAFLAARAEGAEAIALEVGLGGRLDATNVVLPEVAVVTSIGLEHQRILGDTVQLIAREKAGIFKPGRLALHGLKAEDPARPVLEEVAATVGAELRAPEEIGRICQAKPLLSREEGPRLLVELELGRRQIPPFLLRAGPVHMASNALLALAAAEAVLAARGIALHPAVAAAALDGLGVPGRSTYVPGTPPTLFDGAHTRESLAAVAEVAAGLCPKGKIHLVFGVLRERPPLELLRPFLQPEVTLYLTEVQSPRTVRAEELAQALQSEWPSPLIHPAPAAALAAARAAAGVDDLVLVTGSLYLAGALGPDP